MLNAKLTVYQEKAQGVPELADPSHVDSRKSMAKLWRATLVPSRFYRFCIVGGTGVVIDMLILFLLSDPRALGFGLTRSKLVAGETAMLSNFLLNDHWTFRDAAVLRPGWRAKLRRFVGFNAVCSVGLLLNVGLLNLFFNVGGLNRYVSNALAIGMVTAWNYWLNRKLNWSPAAPSR